MVRWGSATPIENGERQALRFYRKNCRYRNTPFRLSFKEFVHLIQQNCFYCGAFPRARVPYKNFIFLYQGIDRKNNAEGYTKGNTVPCCRRCNSIKGSNLSHEEMVFVAQVLLRLTRAEARLRSALAPLIREGSRRRTQRAVREQSSGRECRPGARRNARKPS